MTVTETTTEAGPVETAAPPARGLRPGRMELDRPVRRRGGCGAAFGASGRS